MKPVRYSYGITAALLAGGAAISHFTGQPAGAQVAQTDDRVVPRAGAPARGTTRSSVCATWAPAGWPVKWEMAAPPASRAAVMPYE